MAGKGRPGIARTDLTGMIFGSVKVIGPAPDVRDDRGWLKESRWVYLCDPSIGGCGKQKATYGGNLRSGKTNSCGCVGRKKAKLINGLLVKNMPEYGVWNGMKNRCLNPKNKAYKNYGGRGIKVCERWMMFDNFYVDMGRRTSDLHEIERVDNDRGYEPGNCVWASVRQQSRNTRRSVRVELDGRSMVLSQWAEETGIHHTVLANRLRSGWSVRQSMTVPVGVVRIGKRSSFDTKSKEEIVDDAVSVIRK